MNIPNKIYLYTENKEVLDNDWLYVAPEECESFEYIRTDAFIEKMEKWMKAFLGTHYVKRYRDLHEPSHDDILEGLKNYMKRE